LTVELWVSVEDIAKHLGVAKDSIYRWIETKKLPARRIGRLWKFKLSEVDEWVNAGGAADRPVEVSSDSRALFLQGTELLGDDSLGLCVDSLQKA
jgi:excisionase family DNA binding protein